MTTENEREAFESWILTRAYPDRYEILLTNDDGTYKYIESDWITWQARAQLSTKQEWISVKDELPEQNVFLIFSEKTQKVYLAKLEGYAGSNEWIEEVMKVTHWMPLPESPKP